MSNKRAFILFEIIAFTFLLAGASAAQSLAGPWKYLPYNGVGNMQAESFDDTLWPQMELPSNWYLMGSKEYPKKAFATNVDVVEQNNALLGEIDPELGLDFGGTVWYRRHVTVHPRAGVFTLLEVDMADYYTTVYVNGHEVGSHEGYFQKWALDISKALRDGDNVIALKVSAPLGIYDMAERFPIGWPKHQDQIKGIFGYHDTRPGATSIRGQERSTGGIIRGIALRESQGVDIEHLNVFTMEIGADAAKLMIEVTFHNWTDHAQTVKVGGGIRPANFTGDSSAKVAITATVPPGKHRVKQEVSVPHPQLWWTWDFGKQNLYSIDLQGGTAGKNTSPIAARERFGIRSITKDEHWVFRLNGKRIYHRGSNYISTQWLSQADKAWSDRDVRLMVEANLNAIRIHAHLERPEFYDAADEQGVMIFQDFPLQWGYADTEEFRNEAVKQTGDMVDRYGNHPSIILWCMHNESPHAMDWMQKRDPKQNKELDETLIATIRKLDPYRVSHRDSGTGDGHPYPGWYESSVGEFGRRTFKEPFVTEYGAEAIPDIDTLHKTFSKELLYPGTESQLQAWKFADYQPNQAYKFANVKPGDTLEEMVHKTQHYQAQLVRFATEVFRRKKWDGSTGVYQFMFVDDWPSITWSVLDYFRKPKEGYEAIKSSMQPVLPSIRYQIDDPSSPISLYVVNDLQTAFPGATVHWSIGSQTGEKRMDIPADSILKVEELGKLLGVTQGSEVLNVWVTDNNKREIARSQLSAADFIVSPGQNP